MSRYLNIIGVLELDLISTGKDNGDLYMTYVFGAGITGITTAYYLAKAGYKVTVIDKNPEVAMETSFANGCQLSASNAEVWNSWRNVKKGIKWMLSKDAPLLINPLPSFHKYGWLVQFMMNIKHREQNTIETCEMALEAHTLYKEILHEEGVQDVNIFKVNRGIMHIYRNPIELDHARRTNELYKKAGLNRWEVSPEEMLAIEPALAETKDSIVGGFYNKDDFTADIRMFCVKMSEILKEKYGVQFVQENLNPFSVFKYRQLGPVFVCAGCGSRDLLEQAEVFLPIYPVKGYSITVRLKSTWRHAPWTSILDDETKIVCSRLGDTLRVAGTAEFAGYNKKIKDARVKPLVDWVNQTFPGVDTSDLTPWAGLRPMTPNMMPIVGPSGRYNIWLNTGHGHLGWTLSAFTAKQVVDQFIQSQQKP